MEKQMNVKGSNGNENLGRFRLRQHHQRGLVALRNSLLATALLGISSAALGSQAYGSLNNFDCVNDTGVETHGFEIELDYGHSTDVTYTYDYNHYGIPKISEDTSDPLHPKVFIRYVSAKNPDGTWAAYTAIPAGPINPTQGHQFTDPTVNFGGEHFGVGFTGAPSAVKYSWLIDDGSGNLVNGPPVYISTPSFTYVPAAGGLPAQVIAKVVPPPPPVAPVYQFGKAQWVKEIKTITHNPHKIRLRDLVGDDPGKPQPWANGEQPEVEIEWRLLQTEFGQPKGGKNGELAGAPEGMPGGDEVITRRYEFYKYVGPCDAETGEAMGDTVGPDGQHGIGIVTYADHFDPITGEWVTVTRDMSKFIVVGDFFGTQMAGFDIARPLGLIDHIEDYDVFLPIVKRRLVVPGAAAFTATISQGALPAGLTLNATTGILAGTPKMTGVFNFTVSVTDGSGASANQAYTTTILGPAPRTITLAASPLSGGTTFGAGTFVGGTTRTVKATPRAGYAFLNWTDAGFDVSDTPSYSFVLTDNRSLVANFVKMCAVSTTASPSEAGTTTGDGSYAQGSSVVVTATANLGYAFSNWTVAGVKVSGAASYTFTVRTNRSLTANFVRTYTIAASAGSGGHATGSGTYKEGSTATVKAASRIGYVFVNWTENGIPVSSSATYSFVVSGDRALLANFTKV
jgi:hypothetical protein